MREASLTAGGALPAACDYMTLQLLSHTGHGLSVVPAFVYYHKDFQDLRPSMSIVLKQHYRVWLC